MTNALSKSTGGVFNDAERLSAAVKKLGETFNLVQPGGAVGGELPLLHSAGISFVFVDQNETYRIPGRSQVGIGKNALDRIAAASGVRWDPRLCGKIDDSSDQNFVEYQAVGTVLQLDGTERMITAVKRIDLRADKAIPVEKWGSDAQEIHRNAAKDNRDPWPQILQARQNILSLAESKSKNRAIRSLGVRTAYEPAELAKGFAILRLQFTGRSDDPEIEREVAFMVARRALGSSTMLYGPSSESHALPAPRPASRVPKVITVEAEVEPHDEPEDVPAPTPTSTSAAAPAATGAAPLPTPPKLNPELICGRKNPDGTWPKKRASELSADELLSKIAYMEKQKPTWDKKWAAKNQADLDALKDWVEFLRGCDTQADLDMGGDEGADPVGEDEVPF